MTKRINKPEYALGLRYLAEGGGLTGLELAELLKIDRRNALMYIRYWRDEKKVRICGWRPNLKSGGFPSPVYGIRKGIKSTDVKRPAPLTAAQKSRRHREKMAGLIRAKNYRTISHDFLLLGIKR